MSLSLARHRGLAAALSVLAGHLLASLPAQAQSAPPLSESAGRWYAGFGIGRPHQSLKTEDFSVPGQARQRGIDQKSICSKLFGGYELLPSLSLEMQYACLGRAELKYSGGARETYEAAALSFTAVGRLPVTDQLSLFAKGGPSLHWARSELRRSGLRDDRENKLRHGLTAGIGMEYRINEHYGLRTELETFQGIGRKHAPGRASAHLVSASLFYRF